jgi:hypothetical protein
MTIEPAQIEWYSGYTRYDKPRRLLWKNQWLEVIRVLQRSYAPNGALVKLLASDHHIYLLEYSLDLDLWRVANRSQPQCVTEN